MLNPKTNVGKLGNGVLMTSFAYFQNGRQKIMEFDILLNFFLFFDNVFIPNHSHYVLRWFYS